MSISGVSAMFRSRDNDDDDKKKNNDSGYQGTAIGALIINMKKDRLKLLKKNKEEQRVKNGVGLWKAVMNGPNGNPNGWITKEQFENWYDHFDFGRSGDALEVFENFDKDGNGVLTDDELEQAFSRLDRNDDGRISESEAIKTFDKITD